MSFIDLHVHTTASDGTFTPSEVVKEAINRKLSVIAITDHDTTKGVKEALETLKTFNEELIVVPGVEISCQYDNREVHMLGLFINKEDETLSDRLRFMKEERDRRNDKMI